MLPAALFAALLLAVMPARAFDLFATHEVTAQFATADGKPMANATVRVFAPGNPNTVVESGRTDAEGKFVFSADRNGMWSAEARNANEVARVTIRVGGPKNAEPGLALSRAGRACRIDGHGRLVPAAAGANPASRPLAGRREEPQRLCEARETGAQCQGKPPPRDPFRRLLFRHGHNRPCAISANTSSALLARRSLSALTSQLYGWGDDGLLARFMLKPDRIIVERRPDPVYEHLFPYYVELCATSQFRSKLKGEGGVAGHAVMYIKGACKDDDAPYPQLRRCHRVATESSDPEHGTGISVNRWFRNINWVAIPGHDLFYAGNLKSERAADADPLRRDGARDCDAKRL